MTDSKNRAELGQVSATSSSGEGDLAVRLSLLARSLQDENNVGATLEAITHAAVETIPGAEHAGISVVRRREVFTRAETAGLVRLVDEAQYNTGQGPCLQAISGPHPIRVPDMRSETRWPLFTERAARLGVLSMLSFQLFVHSDNLGALNLYAGRTDAFDDDSEYVGLLFAAHAAVAMSDAQRQGHLTAAMTARDVIGQAKGILMERHKLTADQAFGVLVQASQQSNTKLVDVARALADTGDVA